MVRGDAGTAVAEGRERQLAELSTTTDVFKFLIRLGYNANGHAVTLAIPESGPPTVHDRPFSIPDRGKLSTAPTASPGSMVRISVRGELYQFFETPDYDRLYVSTMAAS